MLWVIPHICVVCTRHGDHSTGHSADGEPAVGFRHPGWRARLWSSANLRRIRFPFGLDLFLSVLFFSLRSTGCSSFVAGQKSLEFLDLLSSLKGTPLVEKKISVSP